ncbi:MAG: ribonuclease Y [Chloroflexi bacterium]|uniref:Ribonuclease Y n=1 Tax=Candidatus Chlorohelix allophototropha TaxID=3003348 RepID=A0A8T7MA70_9CHLR|nr:ribonuclease Y [Chloroflexota bacterium]WJW68871.1 ribonuclease Y [Chloroflexota bacterium L227-S17]
METLLTILFGILAGLACGLGFVFYKQGKANIQLALEKENINRLIEEAKSKQREIVLQAKDEALSFKQEAENELKERRVELQQRESRLQQKEENLEHKLENQERRERNLNDRERDIEKVRKQADELKQRQALELERVAGLTTEQAKELVIAKIEDDARQYASVRVRKIEEEARERSEEKARKVLSVAVSRIASDYISDAVVSTVPLPSDEMKGRIIGREGRNIRAFEQATGVDLIVDDTPEAVTLSCFDPIRREIARRALTKLVTDGRIHQARIEEAVNKAKQEVEQQLREDGEKAAYEVGVQGIHPEILYLLGKLRYRTSYGQNQLEHVIEASKLAGVIASELGAKVQVAKTAALLHDIGKVIDQDSMEGPHALIGADRIKRFMNTPEVIHAVAAHHSEEDPQSVEAWIVMAADALSGGRPGARREQVETYVKRLTALEELAHSMEGVERCFAIQAGRELRILVRPEVIDDVSAMRMAHELSRRIEENIQYPGQIKVTIIRETRAVDYAK